MGVGLVGAGAGPSHMGGGTVKAVVSGNFVQCGLTRGCGLLGGR